MTGYGAQDAHQNLEQGTNSQEEHGHWDGSSHFYFGELSWGPSSLCLLQVTVVYFLIHAPPSPTPGFPPTLSFPHHPSFYSRHQAQISIRHQLLHLVRVFVVLFFLIKSGIKLNAMRGMQDLSLQPGIKPTPLPMEAWSLNHWTAGGVLEQF